MGSLNATSAYGYTYEIDYAGSAVRGNMNLRLLMARAAAEVDTNTTGVHDVVFSGLGQESSVVITLSGALDNASFVDAIVQLT